MRDSVVDVRFDNNLPTLLEALYVSREHATDAPDSPSAPLRVQGATG